MSPPDCCPSCGCPNECAEGTLAAKTAERDAWKADAERLAEALDWVFMIGESYRSVRMMTEAIEAHRALVADG